MATDYSTAELKGLAQARIVTLVQEIKELRAFVGSAPTKVAPVAAAVPVPTKPKRRTMSAAARKALSKRMKARWAASRATAAKAATVKVSKKD
jgi:hypothetical protein